jgi:hypothetical protein
MLACEMNRKVDSKAANLLDWRYFFVDQEGVGHATCGFARHVAKGLLLTIVNIRDFHDPLWEANLVFSGKNRSVLGYHVEYLVLRKILHQGCLTAGAEFGQKGSHLVFRGEIPRPLKDDFEGWILYIPSSPNFRAVDGILVYRSGVKGAKNATGEAGGTTTKGVVVGIQITIAGAHSDSEEKFFSNWKDWTAILKSDEIEFRFLWIVQDISSRQREESIPERKRQPRSGRVTMRPKYTRLAATVKDVAPITGTSLERANELARE